MDAECLDGSLPPVIAQRIQDIITESKLNLCTDRFPLPSISPSSLPSFLLSSFKIYLWSLYYVQTAVLDTEVHKKLKKALFLPSGSFQSL